MFLIVPVIVIIGFVAVGIIIFVLVKGGATWNRNNKSPILTVNAKIVAKRIAVSHSHHDPNNMAMSHSTFTDYFGTFEVESGNRLELRIPGYEYGMLIEGDVGRLTFQGTRYKGFERDIRQGFKGEDTRKEGLSCPFCKAPIKDSYATHCEYCRGRVR